MAAPIRHSRCMCGAVELEIRGEPTAQAYCHCASCRGWTAAPLWAATMWVSSSVRVVKGNDRLGVYRRTEGTHRKFCTTCGTPVMIEIPAVGMVDVPAGPIEGFKFQPTAHVNYGERVLGVADGLPKFRDYPREFGGSGERMPEG